MHFEVLVEDRSAKIGLRFVLEKILGRNGLAHSWSLRAFRGIGRIPKDLHTEPDPGKKELLDHLPKLLRGYGRSQQTEQACVVVVVDLDDKDCTAFKRELVGVLNACTPQPQTLFRIAIEEFEAWLLGDRAAVTAAYPHARDGILHSYEQDSICGTWEVLADAVHTGGATRLRQRGYPIAGRAKCVWAERIAPRMNVDSNESPSFQVFRDGVRNLAGM